MKKLYSTLLAGLLVFSASLLLQPLQVSADDFPTETIRIIVGAKPGGGLDLYARATARYAEKFLPEGINVVVENRPGAGHQIGATALYNAKPDGHTLGMPMMPALYVDQMFHKVNYDMRKLTWLITILHEPVVLSVTPKSGFKTVQDLQKAKSVKFSIVGGESWLILIDEILKIPAEYISGHKNSKEAILAALRGDSDGVCLSQGTQRRYHEKGQLIPVLLAGAPKRLSMWPNVPTLEELGQPELNSTMGSWRVVAAPPNVPEDRIKYLRDLLWKTVHDKEYLAWSKSAKRKVDPMDGVTTARYMNDLMDQREEYRQVLAKYYSK